MANTTFSGPIRAGTIFDTTGTTLGTNVANIGLVEMVQSANITQASGLTTIVLPANSQIVEMTMFTTTAWTGVATTYGVGITGNATKFTAAGGVDGAAIGVVSITPGTDATKTAAFLDIGTADVRILITPTNTGPGVGALVVRYVQNRNLL